MASPSLRVPDVARARVRGVQLAEHFAEHLGEIVVVVDERQELLVHGLVPRPIDAVHVLHVEFLQRLPPGVVEHVGALRGMVEVHLRRELHRLLSCRLQRDLGDVPARQHEHGLAFLVDEDLRGEILAARRGRWGRQRGQLLGFLVPQLVLPDGVAVLVLAQIDELFAVRGQGHVLETGGIDRQPLGAVLLVLELDFHRLLLLVVVLLFLRRRRPWACPRWRPRPFCPFPSWRRPRPS